MTLLFVLFLPFVYCIIQEAFTTSFPAILCSPRAPRDTSAQLGHWDQQEQKGTKDSRGTRNFLTLLYYMLP